MPKNNPVLDTNLIIRFLTNDQPKQANLVEQLLLKSPSHSLEIPDLIIAEIIYVLQSFYLLPRKEITDKITALLDSEKVKVNHQLLKTALEYFSKTKLSFADAYLCALTANGKNSFIYTFDQQLIKINPRKAKTP